MPSPAEIPAELCVSLCEVTRPGATPGELEQLVGQTCRQATFPYCERVYVGSYFCESYFCRLDGAFHESLRAFCERHDVRATMVVPLAGQAFLSDVDCRLDEALERFGDLYDEVVVNDVARFHYLRERAGARGAGTRICFGRLLSKEMRDARIAQLMERHVAPTLSAEVRECLAVYPGSGAPGPDAGLTEVAHPLIELDPVASTLDVSAILAAAPQARIAVHLPYCFATTGRNCTAASIERPLEEKFRFGRSCSLECLRVRQDYLTDEGARYVKHGRTFLFENPGCAIEGASSWRVVYQAGMAAMRGMDPRNGRAAEPGGASGGEPASWRAAEPVGEPGGWRAAEPVGEPEVAPGAEPAGGSGNREGA